MENVDMNLIIAGIVGFIIGAVLFGIIGLSRKSKDSKDYSTLKKAFDDYRGEVNAHFAKTADAVDSLTKSYQEVFNHLSDGAQHLMDKQALQAQLEKRQGKAVTLAYLVDEQNAAPVKTRPVAKHSVVAEKPTPVAEQKKPTDKASDAPTTPKEPSKPAASAPAAAKPASSDKPADKAATQQPTARHEHAKAAASSAERTKTDANVNERVKAAADQKDTQPVKSNVHIAAEKAGLKPAAERKAQSDAQAQHNTQTDNIQKSEHETAIDAVKKHINDKSS